MNQGGNCNHFFQQAGNYRKFQTIYINGKKLLKILLKERKKDEIDSSK
jgi:hypothetical protein